MTSADLALIMAAAPMARIYTFLEPLNDAMYAWAIDEAPIAMAAFLAQLAVESGELRYVRELSDGSQYEGRRDLGNTEPGDGQKFPGRGLGQITGRANTLRCSFALFGDYRLLDTPELLEEPTYAADSAGWFWAANGLNDVILMEDGFLKVCTKWNGRNRTTGLPNGWDQRCQYFQRAKTVLGVE